MEQTLIQIVRTIDAIPDGYVDKDAGIRKAFEYSCENSIVARVFSGETTFQQEYEARIEAALKPWKIYTPLFSLPHDFKA
jgi:hypothetical protein